MMELINQITPDIQSSQTKSISQKIDKKLDSKRTQISIDVFTLVQNARILIKHNEESLAFQLLRQALQKETNNVHILKLMSECLVVLERFDEAEKIYSVLCRLDVSFQNSLNRANNFYKLGKDQEAMQAYYEALALVTDDETALFDVYKNMGNIFVRQGDFESAEENYNKAYTKSPNSDVLLVNYGTLEVQKGDLDKALFCFRKAVEVNPNNDRAWVGLGMVHSQFGDSELAWGNLIKASDINPKNRTALILLGQWSSQMNMVDSIIQKLTHYFSSHSEDTEISILLIKLLFEKGEVLQAHLELTRAFCFNPESSELDKLNQFFNKSKDLQ